MDQQKANLLFTKSRFMKSLFEFLIDLWSSELTVKEDNRRNKWLVEETMKVDLLCQHRGIENETPNHVLFTCAVARQLRARSNFPTLENGFILILSLWTWTAWIKWSKTPRFHLRYKDVIHACSMRVLWLIWKKQE